MKLARVSLLLLSALSWCTNAFAGVVRIAERPQVGPFATLQEAVNAAQEGESLLAAPGVYAPFTVDGKSINLFVTGSGEATITGTVTVRNLAPSQSVMLSRLRVQGTFAVAGEGLALDLDSISGHARLQDSRFDGANGGSLLATTGTAVRARNALNVLFSNCIVAGGTAGFRSGYPPVDGGAGIDLLDSSAALYDCTVTGGRGSEESYPRGGHGGPGVLCDGFGLFAGGSSLRGGPAGGGDYIGCTVGGTGGDGLRVDQAQAHLLADTIQGGSGGWSSCGPFSPAGQAIVATGGAVIDNLAGTRRKLSAARITPDDAAVQVTLLGEPGDNAFLMVATRPAFQFKKTANGCFLLPTPLFSTRLAAGIIGPGGSLVLSLPLPVPDGTSARSFVVQALCVSANGVPYLSGAGHVLSLDVASAPDCNGNGRQDAVDVLFGGAPDCDANLTPDACDADCDGSGVPDLCEIAAGLLPDCNGNGVPDACDLAAGVPDCNGNGLPDSCDIASQNSPDINGNGVPDECEASAQTWHVDAAAPPGGNGSPGSPFQTLAEGVAAAFFGDTVVLADGLYQGPGNRNVDLGGRHLTIRSANGAAQCTLDGQFSGRALLMQHDEGVTLEGLSFLNYSVPGFGGAILTERATLVVRDCVFASCQATSGGGAIMTNYGSLRLERCLFLGNASLQAFWGFGGALHLQRTALRASETLFAFNAGVAGGAVYFSQSNTLEPHMELAHCNFISNTANQGGAMLILPGVINTRHFVDNCQFAGNSAAGDGGAVQSYASLQVSHSTFVDNSAGNRGGALFLRYATSSELSNSILWGGTAAAGPRICVGDGSAPAALLVVRASDVQGGQAGVATFQGSTTWVPGNLDLDPQFVDADGPANKVGTYDDKAYALALASPCVDAGENASLSPDRLDIDGDGDTAEPVPLDLRRLQRRVDVISVPDTGSGTAPLTDMGAMERQG